MRPRSSPALPGNPRLLVALLLATSTVFADDASVTQESEAPGAMEPGQAAEVTRWATRSLGYAQRDLSLGALIHGDGQLYPHGDPVTAAFASQYRGGFVQFDATAGIGTDTEAGAIANGAFDASWELPLCRVLGVSGSGQLGWKESEALAAWTTTGSACLPFPANTVWGSYTHGENVRLSLFDRVATLRERQQTDTINAHVRFLRLSDFKDTLDVAPVDITVDQTTDGSRLGAWTTDLALSFVSWSRRGAGLGDVPRRLSFFHVRITDFADNRSDLGAFTMQFVPFRVENWRLGRHLAFSAGVGVAAGHGRDASRLVPNGAGAPTAMELSSWTGLHADAGLAGAFGAWSPAVRYTRSVSPLFDAQLVRDDRFAGSLAFEKGTWSARGEGFVALQRVFRETGSQRLVAGGTAVELAWAPKGPVVFIGRTEMGRTLTAGFATDPVEAEWDVRATLGLQAHLTGRWPKLR